MITVSQFGSFKGTGRAMSSYISAGSYLGTNMMLGLTVPFCGDFDFSPPQVLGRFHYGSRHTSPKKSLSMHDCFHEHFHGNLSVSPDIRIDVPASAVRRQDYSSPSTHSIISPINGRYFRGHEATSRKMWKTFSAEVSDSSPAIIPQIPFASFPAWCCFTATAPRWQTWPDQNYAGTTYMHYSYLGRRDDGVIIVGITEIDYNEIVNVQSQSVSYSIRATRRVLARSAQNKTTLNATFSKGKWSSSNVKERVSLTASEAQEIIMSGTSLQYPIAGVPDYTILPRFDSNESFDGRISIDSYTSHYDRLELERYLDNLLPIVSSLDPQFVDNRLLHDDLIDSVNYIDINSIAYLAEIKKVGNTFRSIINLSRGKIRAEEIASTWLSIRYGDRLTVKDSIEILHGLAKTSKRSLYAGRYQSHRVRRLRSFSSQNFGVDFNVRTYQAASMYYRDADLGRICNLIRNLMEWDLWPSLKNMWDLIPLSFVVDWFVRVEDLARATDRRIQSQYYDIAAVCDGQKIVVEVPVRFLPMGYNGQLIWSRYTRRISNRLTFSPFRCDAGRPSDKNVIDGISLLIQASS